MLWKAQYSKYTHDTALGLRTFFWLVDALNLAIIAMGISARSFDIIMEHTPQQFSGVPLGMLVILILIGSSIELPFYAIL